MAVQILPSCFRLMAIGLIFYLEIKDGICFPNIQSENQNPLRSKDRQDHLQKYPNVTHESDRVAPRRFGKKGRLETSIIPTNSSGSKYGYTQAEVRILIPSSLKIPDPQVDGLIRASSILMEYDEDTRKYTLPKARKNRKNHRIRHHSHRHVPPPVPLFDDYFAVNEAQLDEPASSDVTSEELETTAKPQTVVRIPVRALFFNENEFRDPAHERLPNKPHRNKFKTSRNDTYIALHSPVRIYIPVRYNEKDSSSAISANKKCVHCSPNITITIPRGETEVAVPAPAVTVCSRLARTRGRINIAVVNGPRPGIRVSEGDYPVELIVWKPGGHVYSCQYKLNVVAKKCDAILHSNDVLVECSNGNLWGSKCKFSCLSGSVLQGYHTVSCEEDSNDVLWSSTFPICKRNNVEQIPTIKRQPCLKPLQPKDGTVVCDSTGENSYPDGSVCQFFCYPGFLIENLFTTSALIVCKNGHWTPNSNVSCLATYCSEPRSPKNGSARCDHRSIKDTTFKSKYKNGTICNFQCDSGYVIPKSMLALDKIMCNAPHWNDSSIPECKQMIPPYPHPKDCRNQTKVANRRGFAKIKPTRFLVKVISGKNFIYGNCTYKGRVSTGVYINHCTAHDAELDITGHCTYSIVVKENSCSPPPKVSHSSLQCEGGNQKSYPRRTICKYVCDEGYVIPVKEKRFQSKVCMPKLKWRPPGIPTCKRAIPPKPKKGACLPQSLFLEGNDTSLVWKPPRFKSSVKGSKVKVQCSLNSPLQVGNYTNKCEAIDIQLGLNSSCEYNVSVQAKGCPVLPEMLFGSISCSHPINGLHLPIGTTCSYKCSDEYVIPTSLLSYATKMCVANDKWNSSLIPACISQIPPTHSDGTCLDRSILIEDLDDIQIDFPEFKSSSGAILEVECQPQNITNYGFHEINCSAFDPQLRVFAFCSFHWDVQNPYDIAELSREEINCSPFKEIENGIIKCNNNDSQLLPVGTVCEVECFEDFTVLNSKRNQTITMCLPSGEWNSTTLPVCIKRDLPTLISGCSDDILDASDFSLVNVSSPIFFTSQNTSAVVSCKPDIVTGFGQHKVSCIAFDNELNTKVECEFSLHLIESTTQTEESLLSSTESHYSSTVYTEASSTTSTTQKPVIPCEPLTAPRRGQINCSFVGSVQNCSVSCRDGYDFPSDFKDLYKGWTACNNTNGLWDYQKQHNIKKLPDCLGELPNTVVKVWVSFSASVEECSSDSSDDTSLNQLQNIIENLLMSRNEDMCKYYVSCESLQVNCSRDSIKDDRFIVNTNWTLQALFNPSDYENSSDVPDPETHIEAILETTHKAITSEEQFKNDLLLSGIELEEDSYKRGFFVLACEKNGYSVDWRTNKCVECQSGTVEQNGECVSCPEGYFQLEPGKTVCEDCPEDLEKFENVPSTCLV